MTYYTTKETAVINVIAGALLVAMFATLAHCQTTASETAGSRVPAEEKTAQLRAVLLGVFYLLT